MPDKFSEVLNEIYEIAEGVARPLGLGVVDIRFGQAGKRRTLEVTIHRPGGSISLDDCEHVSRTLEQILDERATADAPLMQGAYLLEVQSPGIDRQLKSDREFQAFIGRKVTVQSKEKVPDLGNRISGILAAYENGTLTLRQASPVAEGKKQTPCVIKEQVTFALSSLTQVRLQPIDRDPPPA